MSERFWVGALLGENSPAEGETFRKFPEHMTVVPPVEGPYDFGLEFDQTVANFEPLQLITGDQAYFGQNHEVPVRLIQSNLALTALRNCLVSVIKAHDGYQVPDDYTFTPHIAEYHGKLRAANQVITPAGLSVVAYDSKNGQKHLVQHLPFAN